jgi:hypothetical protein
MLACLPPDWQRRQVSVAPPDFRHRRFEVGESSLQTGDFLIKPHLRSVQIEPDLSMPIEGGCASHGDLRRKLGFRAFQFESTLLVHVTVHGVTF